MPRILYAIVGAQLFTISQIYQNVKLLPTELEIVQLTTMSLSRFLK